MMDRTGGLALEGQGLAGVGLADQVGPQDLDGNLGPRFQRMPVRGPRATEHSAPNAARSAHAQGANQLDVGPAAGGGIGSF